MSAAEERAFRKLVRNVRVAGFRQGKVPRKVFEQNFGSDSVTSQAVEDVLPDAYARAIREHDLAPVDRPTMEIIEEDQGRPRRLKATVEVRPTIELGRYKGLPVAQPAQTVTDAEVERGIAVLAREHATLVPVDRPAAIGDVVTLDYEGKIDGVAFDGGTAKGEVTELSHDRFIPGFVEGIVGMRANERKTIEVTFPEDYSASELAGKAATFDLELHDIKEIELPAIDDAFAKSATRNETLEDLRADVRRRLEMLALARARRATGDAVIATILSEHDIPLPPTLVRAETDHLVNDAAAEAARAGSTLAAVLERGGETEEEMRAKLETQAQSRVKATLLIERIAQLEGVTATPADVSSELAALARQYRQPVDKIRDALGGGVGALMEGIVRTKTLDLLIDAAVPGPAAVADETPAAAT